MNPIRYIRRNVLRLTQAGLAAIAGTNQSVVSRWESGASVPDQAQMDRIRAFAKGQGIAWDDRWFFEPPVPEGEAADG